jgi:Cytochrome P460
MKRTAVLLVAVATVAGLVAWMAPSSLGQDSKGQVNTGMGAGKAAADGKTQPKDTEAKPVIVTKIPSGYRDWKFVSAAHEAGELNDIRVVIGNDKAIKAYRAGKPFPEGTIIGRVAWKMVPSEENNKTFGQAQSFVPGDAPDWYLQFMEKDTKKYAATGGWGYSNFDKDLRPLTDEKTMYACFVCHKAVESRDYIFTKYAP